MILTNISVGKTKDYSIQGRTVKTAYLKEPVTGAVKVNKYGLLGNETAVHTDAVYAFSKENYSYWAARLHDENQAWPAGYFAENLTISGLKEYEFCIGDVIAVGEEVQLEVSGPRVPCQKLCWRMKQPESFIRDFALSGRSGVYFNVLKTGYIKPNDEVRILSRDPDKLRIFSIVEYIFGESTANRQTLEQILNHEALSETSRLLLTNQLFQLIDKESINQHRWDGWRNFIVANITEETPFIKSFVLTPEDNMPIPSFRAGQFLSVQLPIYEAGSTTQTITRVWSLSDYHCNPESYRLSIKKEPYGKGSGFMHDRLKEGDVIPISAPMGRFVLDRSGFKPILLIAAGIGITPMLAMLKSHIDKGPKAAMIYLIHCCKNRTQQPLRNELDAVAKLSNVTLLHVYSQPNSNDKLGVDYDIYGRLSIEHINNLVSDCHIIHGRKRLDIALCELDVYMCGPTPFQDQLVQELLKVGTHPDRIFKESFQANSESDSNATIQSSNVHFLQQDKDSPVSVEWRMEDNMSLLELAESSGLTPAHACKVGVCQTCTANLIEGDVHYEVSLSHRPDVHQVLLCCAKPNSAEVIIQLPA